MFLNVKETLLPKLQATPDKGVDTDQRVVEAYAQQAQGEAQEVTIGRALEMGHKASVIFSLAMETAAIFKQAGIIIVCVYTYTCVVCARELVQYM